RDAKPVVSFLDLGDLMSRAPVPGKPLVVIFDKKIDKQGHKGTEELHGLSEQLITKLRRAIERLHAAEIQEVHVVTDHGFLLVPGHLINNLGHPSVPIAQVLRRDDRWCAPKAGIDVTQLIRLPLPGAVGRPPVAFPRGLRTLVEVEGYHHGGISLQETVIPALVSTADSGPNRVRVE